MNNIESALFEEFKRVDSICRDMLSADKGVSTYIEQMETTPASMRYQVAGWDDDYKKLKHIRWVRNKLAHETGNVECTQADVEWLQGFHSRLLNRTDPLAIAAQLEREERAARIDTQKSASTSHNNNRKSRNKALVIAAAVAFTAVAAALIVLLFWFMNQ